jgi:glutamate mutase epsilon subunit
LCGDGCQKVIEKHPDEKEKISAANTLAKILGIEKQIVNMNADMSLNITVDYGDDE